MQDSPAGYDKRGQEDRGALSAPTSPSPAAQGHLRPDAGRADRAGAAGDRRAARGQAQGDGEGRGGRGQRRRARDTRAQRLFARRQSGRQLDPCRFGQARDRRVDSEPSFTPAEKARRQAIETTVLTARTPARSTRCRRRRRSRNFALSIMDGYASGKGPYANLSWPGQGAEQALYQGDGGSRTRSRPTRKARRPGSGAGRRRRRLVAGSGPGLDASQGAADPRPGEQLLGDEAYEKWQAIAPPRGRPGKRRRHGARNAGRARAALAAIKPKPGEEITRICRRSTRAQKQRDDVLEERKTDPLGQANAAGWSSSRRSTPRRPTPWCPRCSCAPSRRRSCRSLRHAAHRLPAGGEDHSAHDALLDNPTLLPAVRAKVDQALGDARAEGPERAQRRRARAWRMRPASAWRPATIPSPTISRGC
jgi:hypothetical protein